MNIQGFRKILFVAGIAVIIVVALVLRYETEKPVPLFIRKMSYGVKVINSLHTSYALRAIAGRTDSMLWFETDSTNVLVKCDLRRPDMQLVRLPVSTNDSLTSLFKTYVNDKGIYIFGGNKAVMETVSWTGDTHTQTIPVPNFTRVAMVNDSSFGLRSYRRVNDEWIQGIVRFNRTSNTVDEDSSHTGESGDAGFSTDGLLLYNKAGYFVYVYYYRNEIAVLDTALRRSVVIPTIEAMQEKGLVTGNVRTGGEAVVSNASPFHDLHGHGFATDSLVFVRSFVIARHEPSDVQRRNIVIDVYNIFNGGYAGSAYVPTSTPDELRDFMVSNDSLFLLYRNSLNIFKLQRKEQPND